MATLGAQVVPGKTLETLRLLNDLDAGDLGVLDLTFGEWMNRPLGREALASVVLPSNGSLYLALMNFEPAALILMERGRVGSRIRALAVADDFRQLGLARTLLEVADDLAREAQLHWLWMMVPSDNLPATACALTCGYRRYRPQFLRRQKTNLIGLGLGHAHVELLKDEDDKAQLMHWTSATVGQGDAWCAALVAADLVPWLVPALDGGLTYLLISGADEVGLAHVAGTHQHRRITLWLDQTIWNSERESDVLKSVLDTLTEIPPLIDIEFGSHSHLRASVERYKGLGFKPIVRDTVVMVRSLSPVHAQQTANNRK